MPTTDLYSGIIYYFQKTNQKKVLLRYSNKEVLSPSKIELKDTIMCSFEHFKFSMHEKRTLSRQARMLLNWYQNLDHKMITTDSNKLIVALNNIDGEMTIEASQYGAYVCLAAIYSGKINNPERLKFTFKDSPLALFPKNLKKKNNKKYISQYCQYEEFEQDWPQSLKTAA